MSLGELDLIEELRAIATHPAARGLADDAAVLGDLVLTHDSIAEGVHFLPDDPPASVGWKLVAVNLSDLAAKGAEPLRRLMSVTIAGDGAWEEHFLAGVAAALRGLQAAALGGDTIALPLGRAARAGADRDRARRRARSVARRWQARRSPVAGRVAGRCRRAGSPSFRPTVRPTACWSRPIAAPCPCSPPGARLPRTRMR